MSRPARSIGAGVALATLIGVVAVSSGHHAWAAGPPRIAIGTSGIYEGDTGPNRRLLVPITLSSPSPVEVAVTVSIAHRSYEPGGTMVDAMPGVDYVEWKRPKVVRFKPSPRTGLTPLVKYATVSVLPNETLDYEPSTVNKVVSLQLSDASNAVITGGESSSYIVDDESYSATGVPGEAPNAVLAIPTEFYEGDSGTFKVRFSITLNHPSAVPIVLSIRPAPSPTGYADYCCVSVKTGTITVNIKPGQVQARVTLRMEGNTSVGPGNYAAFETSILAPQSGGQVAVGDVQAGLFAIEDDALVM